MDLGKSKSLLQKIEKRKLYTCGYYGEQDDFSDHIQELDENKNYQKINLSFNLCSGDKDPLYNVLFGDKMHKNIRYGKLNNRLVPSKFQENIVMYYTK